MEKMQLKGNERLIYKFNPNSKAEFYEISKSKPYKLLVMLCNGKADEISDDYKVWLIKQMKRQTYFPPESVCVLGWRLYFKPYLTRFIYRLVGESKFTIIWGIDRKSVEAYLEEYLDELHGIDRECEQVAELIKLPENY